MNRMKTIAKDSAGALDREVNALITKVEQTEGATLVNLHNFQPTVSQAGVSYIAVVVYNSEKSLHDDGPIPRGGW